MLPPRVDAEAIRPADLALVLDDEHQRASCCKTGARGRVHDVAELAGEVRLTGMVPPCSDPRAASSSRSKVAAPASIRCSGSCPRSSCTEPRPSAPPSRPAVRTRWRAGARACRSAAPAPARSAARPRRRRARRGRASSDRRGRTAHHPAAGLIARPTLSNPDEPCSDCAAMTSMRTGPVPSHAMGRATSRSRRRAPDREG